MSFLCLFSEFIYDSSTSINDFLTVSSGNILQKHIQTIDDCSTKYRIKNFILPHTVPKDAKWLLGYKIATTIHINIEFTICAIGCSKPINFKLGGPS